MPFLSPLDDRYAEETSALLPYFSDEALQRARLFVEVAYFIALSREKGVKEFPAVSATTAKTLEKWVEDFGPKDIAELRTIEKRTRHDVKALEEYMRARVAKVPAIKKYESFVHFGLTSEDVNNLAYGLLMHEAMRDCLLPAIDELSTMLQKCSEKWWSEPMLSLTHGQAATPTTVGAALAVFADRLDRQRATLAELRMSGKFGGAVGNFHAHRLAYPKVNWHEFGARFVAALGLVPLVHTTQINPHDDMAEFSHAFCRTNNVLLNLCRDCWHYISRGVFKQVVKKGEVGSSTMPHKVNPIDFENAEGNLGMSTALFSHFAEKLSVSRLQRDLSDSTVQRNLGTAFGHHLLAVRAIIKGMSRLDIDRAALDQELDYHPEVIAEAIQTVLRKHGHADAYDQLKTLTRGTAISRDELQEIIAKLPVPGAEREKLLSLL